MAIDRISEFILGGISNRFNMPNIMNYNGRRNTNRVDILLETDLSTDIIEVPAFCAGYTYNSIENRMTLPEEERNTVSDKIVYTIIGSDQCIERRQVNTILKDFTFRSWDSKMAKILNKGNLYYGYPGVITDSDFNTLVCFKVRIHKEKDKIRISDYICYVSPRVFSNQDGIIEKTIYKKIIPFCAGYVLHNDMRHLLWGTYNFVKYDWEGKHIQVVVKDDVECFLKPSKPIIKDFETEDLIRNILLENIDSFI